MPDIIQLLPDHVANQIAAGEVVQRPASVVKELLENAIDAQASIIKLLIKDAGKTLVQVIDNGMGMSPTDARLSFERHATSKIRKAEDLFQLSTKGFRGEALASIAAIAHVELKTKKETDNIGTHIIISGSEVQAQEPIAAPTGTSIAVKNLFYNIPARRNFLKSDKAETRHIINELQRVALAHPDITFFMYHNDHEIYHLQTGNLRQRIVGIFGKKTNEKLIPIQEKTAILDIEGFVAKPEFAKKQRGEQFFFVNSRFIKSPYLNHAVKAAFEGLLSNAHHPSYFIFLNIPTEKIDINIHPTKTEIKFDNEHDIYALIRTAVKHSLGQYNVAPLLDFNRDASMDTPYRYKDNAPTKQPNVSVDRSFNPFKNEPKPSWEALYTDTDQTPDAQPVTTDFTEETPENVDLFQTTATITTHQTQQLQQKYIVSTIKSGMVFIHQNRAHQRILYEKHLTEITIGEIESQQLLFPIQFQFDKPDILLFQELQADLESSGFSFESVSEEQITVNAIPSQINETSLGQIFEDLIASQSEELQNTSFSLIDHIAKTLAKNSAIKVGQELSIKEQEELVNELFSCKEPMLSPFGKKNYTTLSVNEIDNRL